MLPAAQLPMPSMPRYMDCCCGGAVIELRHLYDLCVGGHSGGMSWRHRCERQKKTKPSRPRHAAVQRGGWPAETYVVFVTDGLDSSAITSCSDQSWHLDLVGSPMMMQCDLQLCLADLTDLFAAEISWSVRRLKTPQKRLLAKMRRRFPPFFAGNLQGTKPSNPPRKRPTGRQRNWHAATAGSRQLWTPHPPPCHWSRKELKCSFALPAAKNEHIISNLIP